MTHEVNFDGIVGPTHHYGGLGRGNLASQKNAASTSSPRQAALQGLDKMAYLLDRGLLQGILLPHERPHIPTLRRLGFDGSDHQILQAAFKASPGLVSAVSSASAMWAANAATVTPSTDSRDGRVHLTPANLTSHLHRSIEAHFTRRQLKMAFAGERFVVHDPLPPSAETGDEGAANHTRLTTGAHSDPGAAIFVHGGGESTTFRARQSQEASMAVARQHTVRRLVSLRQSATVIDQGVFHNDVIAVGDRDLLIAHEDAYETPLGSVASEVARLLDGPVRVLSVPRDLLPVDRAVGSYLFNSQLLQLPDGSRLLLAPEDVRQDRQAWQAANWLLGQGVDEIHTMDLRQSMANGGGPACLRLRVVLNDPELAAVNEGFLVDASRIKILREWVNRHYRESLHLGDLADPAFLDETRAALDELTSILGLGALYDFQR